MKEKTFDKLEQELVESKNREKNLQKRVSSWRMRSLEDREMLRSLIGQYERIVREWKKMYEDLLSNGWKILFVKIHNKYNKLRGR